MAQEEHSETVELLKDLKQSAARKMIEKVLEDEIEDIENALFEIDGEKNQSIYTENDLIRTHRNILVDLKTKPDQIIAKIQSVEEVDMSDEV